MPYEKQPIIRMFLRTPGLQQQINKPEKDLRSQVHCYQDPTSLATDAFLSALAPFGY